MAKSSSRFTADESERIILAVEEYPLLYNLEHPYHDDKHKTIDAWYQICGKVIPEWDSKPKDEKEELSKYNYNSEGPFTSDVSLN